MLTRTSRLALFLAAAPLVAQGVSSQMAGRVMNAAGTPLAGAKVMIRNMETGLNRTAQTAADGRFLFSLLPVGAYTISVEKDGYQSAHGLRANLNLGDASPIQVRLAAVAAQTVEVVAAQVQTDPERASTAAYVSPDALTQLPVFNRSFTSLATLTPQVVVDSQRGNLSIGGQRGVNSSINIDGGDNNEPFFGGAVGAAEGKTPFTISIEAIREYQVVTDGASAEFGRMGGGYVNAITKNGTNEMAGSLFYYTRPQSMVARQPNLSGVAGSNEVGDFKQEQFGFSVGGPIFKDKLFYFVAYDAQRRSDPVNQQWGGSTPVTLDPATYANDAVLIAKGGDYTPRADSDAIFARIDWNLNNDHQIVFRVNHSNFKGDAYTGTMSSYENTISDDIKTLSVVGQWNWVIGANWMNEFKLNIVQNDMPRTTRASTPQVNISNVGYYGANPYPREYTTKRYQLVEAITYATPTYQIKAGIDWNRIQVEEIFSSFWQGGYSFSTVTGGATPGNALTQFRLGNWSNYTQRFSLDPSKTAWEAGSFDAEEDQQALFIQGDVRLSSQWKVGLGVRWDRQTHPSFAIADFSNPTAASLPVDQRIPYDNAISPRVSFVWTPAFDQKLVVRGSAGRYVSPTPSVFLYQAYTVNGVRMAQVDFRGIDTTTGVIGTAPATYGLPIGSAWDAANPASLPAFPTGATAPRSDIFTFSQDFKNPRTDRVNVQVERTFHDAWVLGLAYTYAKGRNLERLTDINLATPVISASGRAIFPTARPNTSYAKMMMYVSDVESIYRALTFSAKYQKDGSPFFGQLYYTWSKDKDGDSNERNFSSYSTMNTQDLDAEWGYSERDRRHVVNVSMGLHERWFTGLNFGVAFRYLSGFPYSNLYPSGSDINRDGIRGNDRAYVNGVDTGRNTLRSASTMTVDLKVFRDFPLWKKVKVQVSAEIFDVLNRHDTYLVNYTDGSDLAPVARTRPAFIGGTRQVQLGARLSF